MEDKKKFDAYGRVVIDSKQNSLGFFRTAGFVCRTVYETFRGQRGNELYDTKITPEQTEFSNKFYHKHFSRRK